MEKRVFLLLFVVFLISCGERDFSRPGEKLPTAEEQAPLIPDLFVLFSYSTDSVRLTLRQISEDETSASFTNVTINRLNDRVLFDTGSVGSIDDCEADGDASVCKLVFFANLDSDSINTFMKKYEVFRRVEPLEAFVFEDAPANFSSSVCDATFGSSLIGEKTTITVQDKETDDVLVTFLYNDFGSANQGRLLPPADLENITLYYGLDFDSLFDENPYAFSGVRKDPTEDVSYLEVQAIQENPTYKRSVVCFND